MRPTVKTIPTLLLIVMWTTMAYAQTNPQSPAPNPTNQAAKSDARKAFEKMKTLAGSWHGPVMGMSINVTFSVGSSGTAILNEATADGGRPPNHELTVFYVDGDRLLATHYCDGGNRSRMEAKISADGNTVDFNTLDVEGGTQRGFTKRLVFTITDVDHHAVELTYMQADGKPIVARGEFQRTK